MILPEVTVGKGCVIHRAVIDSKCEIPDGMTIGVDRALDETRFFITKQGVVLVTADMLRKVE